jgi:hypothetical protein
LTSAEPPGRAGWAPRSRSMQGPPLASTATRLIVPPMKACGSAPGQTSGVAFTITLAEADTAAATRGQAGGLQSKRTKYPQASCIRPEHGAGTAPLQTLVVRPVMAGSDPGFGDAPASSQALCDRGNNSLAACRACPGYCRACGHLPGAVGRNQWPGAASQHRAGRPPGPGDRASGWRPGRQHPRRNGGTGRPASGRRSARRWQIFGRGGAGAWAVARCVSGPGHRDGRAGRCLTLWCRSCAVPPCGRGQYAVCR